MHIPFVRMVKFKLFAQFPVDDIPHPVVSSLIIIRLICCIPLCDWSFRLCHLIITTWSVCFSSSHWSLCFSFSRKDAGLCIYHLFVYSNLNFLRISYLITLPTQLWARCGVLYPICANLLHSLIMWLMVPSLSPLSLHLLFSWVISYLTLILLVLLALFCAAIRRYYVFFLRYSFLSLIQFFFSREMLLISHIKLPWIYLFLLIFVF